jgi:hypothetical protein
METHLTTRFTNVVNASFTMMALPEDHPACAETGPKAIDQSP